MKNLVLKPLNLIYNVLIAFVVMAVLFGITPQVVVLSIAVGALSGIALGFVKNTPLALMAIQVEIWENHIEQEIFKDNTFLRKSYNADDYVINSKAVHIPQSGGSGNVVKNRAVVPATVRKRNDTDVIYLLDEFTTDPVLIPDADTKELSYDKRNSVLDEDRDKIVEVVAEETIYNWLNSPAYGTYGVTALPAANKLLTSGNAVVGTAPGATGNRKAATLNDLQKMQTYFRSINRWFNDKMYCMLTPEMLAQIFPADSQITATYMQNVTESERREGIMFKAQGWKIMSRSTVTRTLVDGSIIAPGAIGNVDDDAASLFWYEKGVEFAFGGVEAFQDLGNPLYYGDVYSFLARSGSRARREDYKGVAILREDKAV